MERPKLSYKRKKKKSPARSPPTAADAGSDADGPPHTLSAMHGGSFHVGHAVGGGDGVGDDAETVTGEVDQDYSASNNNRDQGADSWEELGNEEGQEEPYERPKLSYRGGGLQSSSSTAPASSSWR